MKRKLMPKFIALILAITCIVIPASVHAETSADYSYKIDSHLLEKLNTMDSSDKVDVSIWIDDIDSSVIDQEVERNIEEMINDTEVSSDLSMNLSITEGIDQKNELSTEAIDDLVLYERREKSKLYQEHNNDVYNKLFKNSGNGASNSKSRTSTTRLLYTSKYAPNFEVTLTKDEILKVVENKNVTDVFERTTGCIENNIVSFNSSNVARTLSYDVENDMSWYFDVTGITKLRDEYGLDGTGVKVGTIEGYVPDTSVPCFANSDITNRPSDVENWLSAPNGHMNYTTSIMAALTSEYTGGIPNAKFYAASTNNNLQGAGEMKGAFEWVISQGVSVITSSVSLGHDNENEYGDYAKWLDHVTNQHNVLFVMAGPHANSNMGSGGMSYNAVVVGSSDDDQETVTSGWLNGTTDPYKPDIIAPGDMIRTPIGTGGATSAAAPIVACAAAQLIQKYPLLKTNPMMTKTLLLNGTKYLGQENEMNPSTQTTGFTREGGAGILNVENSMLPMVTTESILYSLNNGNDTYNGSAYVSSADINNNKQLRITVCSTKNNLVSGIHTSGNVENNPITAFNITVKKRGNNDYWRSYNYYDNKTAVCFTPPSRGYYDITVTRITNFDNDSSFYLAISRHN